MTENQTKKIVCTECGTELNEKTLWYANFDKEQKTPLCFHCCDNAEQEHDFPNGLPYTEQDREIDDIHGVYDKF